MGVFGPPGWLPRDVVGARAAGLCLTGRVDNPIFRRDKGAPIARDRSRYLSLQLIGIA